jgi:ORF6N domain
MPTKKPGSQQFVPDEVIERRILLIRGHKVMLDRDLAALYEVKPIALRQAVKRNSNRFPADFVLQLTKEEAEKLVSQSVIPSRRSLGGFQPYAFTEQGVAMLSSVLRSERAAIVNIAIMRTFVRLRQILATHKELAERLEAMEKKYDQRFKVVFDILKQLMEPLPDRPKGSIGFLPPAKRKK